MQKCTQMHDCMGNGNGISQVDQVANSARLSIGRGGLGISECELLYKLTTCEFNFNFFDLESSDPMN